MAYVCWARCQGEATLGASQHHTPFKAAEAAHQTRIARPLRAARGLGRVIKASWLGTAKKAGTGNSVLHCESGENSP